MSDEEDTGFRTRLKEGEKESLRLKANTEYIQTLYGTLPVIPIQWGKKQPIKGAKVAESDNDGPVTVERLRKIFSAVSEREIINVALATGWRSGLFVFDFDPVYVEGRDPLRSIPLMMFDDWLKRLNDEGIFPAIQESRSGGKHMIFKMTKKVECITEREEVCGIKGFDIRSTGGYFLVEPSYVAWDDSKKERMKPEGTYKWVKDRSLPIDYVRGGKELPEVPDWIMDFVCPDWDKVAETAKVKKSKVKKDERIESSDDSDSDSSDDSDSDSSDSEGEESERGGSASASGKEEPKVDPLFYKKILALLDDKRKVQKYKYWKSVVIACAHASDKDEKIRTILLKWSMTSPKWKMDPRKRLNKFEQAWAAKKRVQKKGQTKPANLGAGSLVNWAKEDNEKDPDIMKEFFAWQFFRNKKIKKTEFGTDASVKEEGEADEGVETSISSRSSTKTGDDERSEHEKTLKFSFIEFAIQVLENKDESLKNKIDAIEFIFEGFNTKTHEDMKYSALFLAQKEKKFIVYSKGKEPTFYVGNQESKLWIEGVFGDVRKVVSNSLKRWCLEWNVYFTPYLKTMREAKNMIGLKSTELVLERLCKMSKGFGRKTVLDSLIACASCDLVDQEKIDTFDRNPHLLPLKGGLVYDLETDTTRDRKLKDGFTKEINVDLSDFTEENYEVISKFMLDIMCQDQNKLEWLCSWIKMTFYWENKKAFIIFKGPTDSGKTTLSHLIQDTMGEFSTEKKRDWLIVKNVVADESGTSADVIQLSDKRPVIVEEVRKTDRLDEGSMLTHSGGGRRTAGRGLYERKVKTICSEYTVIILCNVLPYVPWTPEMLTRLILILFESRSWDTEAERQVAIAKATATGKKEQHLLKNRSLKDLFKQTNYCSAFFAFVMNNATKNATEHPTWCKQITTDGNDDIVDENKIEKFVHEHYIVPEVPGGPSGGIPVKDIYKKFKEVVLNGIRLDYGEGEFIDKMKEKFGEHGSSDKGARRYFFRIRSNASGILNKNV